MEKFSNQARCFEFVKDLIDLSLSIFTVVSLRSSTSLRLERRI